MNTPARSPGKAASRPSKTNAGSAAPSVKTLSSPANQFLPWAVGQPQPRLADGILSLAAGYGSDERFWFENLDLNANPHAIWRALMVYWARQDDRIAEHACLLLKSPSSRVRAWACRYLAAVKFSSAFLDLFAMTNDPSPRVRLSARQAVLSLKPAARQSLLEHRKLRFSRYSVLASEDDPCSRLRLEDMLAGQGFKVAAASSEIETLGIARKLKPHFLVTDNQKLNGEVIDNLCGLNMTWDLCRQPDLSEMVIIMLSPDALEPAFLWQGGDAFLQTRDPADPALLALLREYAK